MNTPRIQDNIDKLHSDVSQFSTTKKYIPENLINNIYSSSTTVKIYVGIPIVTLLVLCTFTPDFVKVEYTDESNDIVKIVSYKKVFIYWLILSTIFLAGFFGYNYKLAKNSEIS